VRPLKKMRKRFVKGGSISRQKPKGGRIGKTGKGKKKKKRNKKPSTKKNSARGRRAKKRHQEWILRDKERVTTLNGGELDNAV